MSKKTRKPPLTMNKQAIKGETDKIKGKVRVAKGKLTGNRLEVMKGRGQQARGSIRKKIGRIKDAL